MSIGHNGGPPMSSFSGGWIAIARSMRGHPIVGFHLHAKPADPSKGALQPALAFIDLIMECRYEDGFVQNGGRKMELQRGQLVGAVSWLAARWNWTPMAVRIWLDKLEADLMISRYVPGSSNNNKHVGRAATVITVCNYDEYQSQEPIKQQTEQQTNSKQATNEQQQYKDNKETNNYSPIGRPIENNGDVEDIGCGVLLNCETIRHPDHPEIAINFKSIEGLTLGTVPIEQIKTIASGYAIDWAHQLESGKSWKEIAGRYSANQFIANRIHWRKQDDAVTDVRKQRAAKPAAKSTGLNWCSAEGIEEAMREIQKSEGKR